MQTATVVQIVDACLIGITLGSRCSKCYTARQERFARETPTVGSEIDTVLVFPIDVGAGP